MKTQNQGKVLLLAAVLLTATAVSTYGQRIVIAQHSGANNPTNEGFNLYLVNGTVGPVTDLGVNAWTTGTPISGGGNTHYYQTLTSQQQADLTGADWILSLTLRVVQGPFGSTVAQFYTGSEEFGLFFGVVSNGDPIVNTYVLNGAGSTYNNYQIIYSAATGTASLWVNGTDAIGNITGSPSAAPPLLYWGENQGGPFQANWNLVSLQIIPEPSSFVLLGLGSTLLLARPFRRAQDKTPPEFL